MNILRWSAVLLFSLFWTSLAFAAGESPSVTYGANTGTVTGGTITKSAPSEFSRLLGSSPTGAWVQDTAKVKVGTSDFDMLLKRPILSKNIVQVGALALKSLPAISTGVALWELYDMLRVRPDGAGGLKQDPGQDPVTELRYRASGGGPYQDQYSAYGSSRESACSALTPTWLASAQSQAAAQGKTYELLSGLTAVGLDCRGTVRVKYIGSPYVDYEGGTSGGKVTGTPVQSISCPASIDPSDPSGSVPAGSAPTSDNKCRTARYNHGSISPAEVAERYADFPSFQFDPKDLVKDSLDKGVDIQPYMDGPGSLQGPASVPGPAVTTTNTPAPTPENPNPSPQTTTTNTTINITYNQNNTWNQSSSTTITNPDGSTTTEEGEEASPPPDPDLPGVPDLYTKKYPDGFAGAWAARTASLQQTPIFTFLTTLVPSTAGEGGCPAWSMPVMYGLQNIQTVDISLPCWLWGVLKTIMTISALLLCRRLIFGG